MQYQYVVVVVVVNRHNEKMPTEKAYKLQAIDLESSENPEFIDRFLHSASVDRFMLYVNSLLLCEYRSMLTYSEVSTNVGLQRTRDEKCNLIYEEGQTNLKLRL